MVILELRMENWSLNPKSTPYSLLPILMGFEATIARLQLNEMHHRVDKTSHAPNPQGLSSTTTKTSIIHLWTSLVTDKNPSTLTTKKQLNPHIYNNFKPSLFSGLRSQRRNQLICLFSVDLGKL